MSREYTEEEIREKFIRCVWSEIDYWNTLPNSDFIQTTRDRLAGLAFSILVTLDGEAGEIPGFHVVPCVSPEDKDYHIEQGENWYPEVPKDVSKNLCDIGGSLHEVLQEFDPQRRK